MSANPFDLLAGLAYQLVSGAAFVLEPLCGTAATATAIVLVTLAVRAALVPAARAQRRADKRRAELLDLVAGVRKKHSNNAANQRAALSDLYQAEGAGLLRTFVPMLVQAPVFAGLYRVFLSPTVGGHANLLLQQTLWGVPLSTPMLAATGAQFAAFGLALAALALAAFAWARVLPATGPRPRGVAGVIARVAPYAPVATAVFLPLAATVYLITSTAWTAAQTALLRG